MNFLVNIPSGLRQRSVYLNHVNNLKDLILISRIIRIDKFKTLILDSQVISLNVGPEVILDIFRNVFFLISIKFRGHLLRTMKKKSSKYLRNDFNPGIELMITSIKKFLLFKVTRKKNSFKFRFAQC